mmetsp:Transcript_7992/g.7559  ORF Transcript_7992/g.7559 Transcript_7992/m.7559 type:complete len:114 (+) Transcript_7992:97-438(+)
MMEIMPGRGTKEVRLQRPKGPLHENNLGKSPIAPKELIGLSIYQVSSKNPREFSKMSGSMSHEWKNKSLRYGIGSRLQLKDLRISSVISRRSKCQSINGKVEDIDDLTALSAE